jgi:hypothetical protein
MLNLSFDFIAFSNRQRKSNFLKAIWNAGSFSDARKASEGPLN